MRQNPHVRICGGPGSATTLVYPTPNPAVLAQLLHLLAPRRLSRQRSGRRRVGRGPAPILSENSADVAWGMAWRGGLGAR